MKLAANPLGMLCVLLLLMPITAHAQSASYHLDIKSGVIFFVNDSQKTVEAFQIDEICEHYATIPAAGLGSPSEMHDYLQGPRVDVQSSSTEYLDNDLSSSGAIASANGKLNRGVAQPGDRWMATSGVPGGCRPRVSAVLFEDGTYDGDVKDLKARRDGIRSRVSYWLARLKQSKQDGSDAADAERFVAQDLHTSATNPFLKGQLQVDLNVRGWFRRDCVGLAASGCYAKLLQRMESWEKKINADEAMKALDILFPRPAR